MKIHIEKASEYWDNVQGYVIEKDYVTSDGKESFAIPDWIELSYPDLAETFPNRQSAIQAIINNDMFDCLVNDERD